MRRLAVSIALIGGLPLGFYALAQAGLLALGIAVLFLGVSSALMFWRGVRYGRRPGASAAGGAWRAGLWSLAFCWSVYAAGVGHGIVTVPLPAWLLLANQILSHGDVMIPPPWLALVIPLAAYAIGGRLAWLDSRSPS